MHKRIPYLIIFLFCSLQVAAQTVSELEDRIIWLTRTSLIFALVIILLTIATFKYSKKLKSQSKNMEAREPLNDDAPSKEGITTLLESSDAADPGASGNAAVIDAVPEPVAPAVQQANQFYFTCEVMMTSGPRKKFMGEENADKDLGEDVCGFVSISDQVLIWLLDGTSDLHCLRNPVNKHEYFSSRLLALGIAEKLKLSFLATLGETPVSEMVNSAIAQVKKEWLEVIEKLPDMEKQVLKLNIGNKNFPECAATILIAGLKQNGDLTAYRSGDSKMLFFRGDAENKIELDESSLADKNEQSNDRIFFRLKLDDQGKFEILYNEPLHEVVTGNSISSVICFSDGIGKDTEQLLMETYKTDPEKARREIIYHSQETGDDKSICFIGINPMPQTLST